MSGITMVGDNRIFNNYIPTHTEANKADLTKLTILDCYEYEGEYYVPVTDDDRQYMNMLDKSNVDEIILSESQMTTYAAVTRERLLAQNENSVTLLPGMTFTAKLPVDDMGLTKDITFRITNEGVLAEYDGYLAGASRYLYKLLNQAGTGPEVIEQCKDVTCDFRNVINVMCDYCDALDKLIRISNGQMSTQDTVGALEWGRMREVLECSNLNLDYTKEMYINGQGLRFNSYYRENMGKGRMTYTDIQYTTKPADMSMLHLLKACDYNEVYAEHYENHRAPSVWNRIRDSWNNYLGGCADIADILTGDTVQMNCIDFFKMRAQQYYEAGMQKQYEECFSIIDELIRMSSGEDEDVPLKNMTDNKD